MKYVLVTGAGGGMGEAVVQKLSDNGYCVFALDRQPIEKRQNVIPLQVDLCDSVQVEKAFEYVKEKTDKLYAIIHFAGIYMLDSLFEISEQEFTRAFSINVFSAFRVNKIFQPLLKKGSKIIITTSELAPLDPLPFTGLYAITKSTLDKYAFSLRMEAQLLGVSVTALRCGAIDTGMINHSTQALERFCNQTKLYSCNAKRFKTVVDRVEARKVSPQKVANKVAKTLNKKRAPFIVKINRNPLLLLLNLLPERVQTAIIKKILK